MGARNVIVMFILTLGVLPPLGSSVWGYEGSVIPAMNGDRGDFAERRAGREFSASIRFGIANEGLYRLTYSVLTNAGVSPALLIGNNIRVFCRTQEVAISVSSTGTWTSTDYLLLAGVGYDGYYTPTNVYWLGFGAGGKRMASRSASPFPGIAPVTSHRFTALHHDDYYFKDNYRWNDNSLDHWIDRVMSYYALETNFTLVTDNVLTGIEARMEAVMMGKGINTHTTRLRINTDDMGLFNYAGEVTVVLATNFQATALLGSNVISMRQFADPLDLAYLERFSITYSRSLVQANNSLFFDGVTGSNTFRVTGFSSSTNYTVLEVNDLAAPVLLTGSQVTNMGTGVYAVLFSDNAAATSRYAVCQAGGIRDIPAVQRTSFRDLVSTNRQADYIIICPYEFRSEVYRLLALRHLQGLSVAVAPLPDIYNEFSYGIADAAAIKQFIGYAFHHWQSSPKYILLAGSGSYNPRYLAEPHSPLLQDKIPVHMGAGNGLWVSLDGWYAAVNEPDAVPDVPLGRLPVVTAGELKAVTDKIVSFEGMPTNYWWRSQMLMVCDTNSDGYKFDQAANTLIAARVNTNVMTVSYVRGTNSTPQSDIVYFLNSGVFLVNYFGHGDPDQWSGVPMLLVSDVVGLLNSVYPVVSMMTCLNGAFQSSKNKCLSAYFLSSTSHGASACVAASGLASLNAAEPFMDGLYGAVLGERRKRIGDCLLPAYWALADKLGLNATELQFLELLGDPAMIVNP